MASYTTGRPAPIGVKKRISIREFFGSAKRKKIGAGVVVLLAAIGIYLLFFVGAAPNNCSPVQDGGICDVNQAANKEGTDSLFSVDAEVQNKINNEGWQSTYIPSVPFRAPNFPQNGAVPLWRFYREDITAHFLVLEGTPEFNTFTADSKNVKQGIIAYAWPDGRQPGTVPIYRVNRKPLYFLQIYTDNQAIANQFATNPDGTWENGGINFYAYPSNYFPPVPASTATKDTDCATQSLAVGDKGACVQTLKGILNGYVTQGSSTAEQLDINNNTFDAKTKDYTTLFVLALKNKGVQVPDYTGVVTKEIWTALEAGYPAAGRATTGVDATATISPCPQGGGDAEAGLKEYIAGVAAGKKYDTACHTFWLTYAKNKSTAPTSGTAAPTAATSTTPTTAVCPKIETGDQGLAAYIDGVNNKKLTYDNECHKLWLGYPAQKAALIAAASAPTSGTTAQTPTSGIRYLNCPTPASTDYNAVRTAYLSYLTMVNKVNTQPGYAIRDEVMCRTWWSTIGASLLRTSGQLQPVTTSQPSGSSSTGSSTTPTSVPILPTAPSIKEVVRVDIPLFLSPPPNTIINGVVYSAGRYTANCGVLVDRTNAIWLYGMTSTDIRQCVIVKSGESVAHAISRASIITTLGRPNLAQYITDALGGSFYIRYGG